MLRTSITLRLIFGALLALLSASCVAETPAPTPTPLPTPAVLNVHLASELAPMRPAIAACASGIGDAGVLVFETLDPDLPETRESVTFRLGYPAGFSGHASLVGNEEIVLVADANSEIQIFSAQDLLKLFAGETGAPAGLEVWIPLPGTESRRLLDEWSGGAAYTPEGFLAPGPERTLEVLEEQPGAIGVLPSAWVSQDLQVLFSLGDAPVLALTQDEPIGKLRELIGCLQGENAGD